MGGSFLFILIGLPFAILWIWVVVDVLRRPSDQWVRARHSQLVWVLAIIFFSPFSLILYLVIARPALQRAAETGATGSIVR